jgi:uncharacterized membrane protein YozB (DUF420 family)
MMHGFLGTRADFIVDFIMVITGFLPIFMLYSFYLASKGRYTLHKNLQLFLLLLSSIAVIALELDIRLGGVENITTQSSYYNTTILKTVFAFHLIVAISSFFLWSWMVFKFSLLSVAKIKRTNHKFWGKILFIDLVLTLISGWAIYVMIFAL